MWRLRLFGGVSIRLERVGGCEEQAAIHRFRTRKVASLLGYLALQNELQLRETVANFLWPEATASEARNSLRVALAALRSQLEPIGVEPNSVLRADRLLLGLQPTTWTSDVGEFESLWKMAASQKDEQRATTLARAFALYKGTLLLGYEEEWAEPLALYYESLFERITEELVAWHRKNGQFELSLETLGNAARYLPHYDGFAVLSRQIKRELALRESKTTSVGLLVSICADGIAPIETTEVSASIASLASDVIKSDPLRGTVLPLYATTLCGREEDIATLLGGSRFDDDRVLRCFSLVGPPAIGKTRLGVEAARQLERKKWSRVFFVSFSGQNEDGNFAEILSAALGLKTSPFVPVWTQLVEQLKIQCASCAERAQSVILFLDDVAPLNFSLDVQRLRLLVPELVIWASSRVWLRLPGEQPLMISGLPEPEENQDIGSLSQVSSVELFVRRARSANPNFSLSNSNAKAVARLCRRLEGWPLSLELAAARAHSFTPQQMLDQLRESNDFLRRHDSRSASSCAATKRHSSFETAIEWSYTLLEKESALTLLALSVFRDGATAEALQNLMSRWPQVSVQTTRALLELVAHSLVKCHERDGVLHYHLHEGVRQFAWNRLDEPDRIRLSQAHVQVLISLVDAPSWTEEASSTQRITHVPL